MSPPRCLATLLAATALSTAPATASDPAPAPARASVAIAPVPAAAAPTLPPTATRLHIYILDGVNPLGLAGVGQLADRLRRVGFQHVRVGGWYNGGPFEREILAAHAADPEARFAVVGYSAGTYAARALANRLVRAGVPVSVVAYVGGDYLTDTLSTRVPGAGRVVNVTGDGYLLSGRNLLFNGTDVSGAANVRLAGTWHYGLPTHPTTFAALYTALAADIGY
jgi:hypothetical protein